MFQIKNPNTMWLDKPYHSLDFDCKSFFGEKIYKIAIDGGMTCPTRDGSKDTRGCIFCSESGSGDFSSTRCTDEMRISIHDQISHGKTFFKGKNTGTKYIAYFQSFTNTYAPVEYLATIFTEALNEPDVVGISIATRPDCLPKAVISLLGDLQLNYPNKFIWVELGLQTLHEDSALYIRRGYPLSTFEKAVTDLHTIHIPIIVHVIIGLPNENKEMILQTCKYLNTLPIDGIKLQLLHVLENTDLAIDYQKNTFEVLDEMEYIDIVISCLEILNPNITIHRLTGDGPKDLLIAPLWSLNKRNVLNTLLREMRLRNTWQGKYYVTNISERADNS